MDELREQARAEGITHHLSHLFCGHNAPPTCVGPLRDPLQGHVILQRQESLPGNASVSSSDWQLSPKLPFKVSIIFGSPVKKKTQYINIKSL